jgi:ABC-type phosphate/phosphonate transport system substrate-binding protein
LSGADICRSLLSFVLNGAPILKNPKFLLLLPLMLALIATPVISSASINMGVLAPRGKLKSMKRWKDFASYMSEQLGQPVTITPLPPAEVVNTVRSGSLDLVLTNPVHAVSIVQLHGGEPLATLNKKSGPVFAGVIVAKKGMGITRAEDLVGKKVMSLKFRAAAGAYTFQTYHLHQKGIDPHKDFASMVAGKKQDDLVLAVKAEVIDAAFVRSGILESMQREGKISLDEFTVVDQRKNDRLKLVHSTNLYPEWYLLSLPSTDSSVSQKAKQAALRLTATDPAAQTAKIQGFVDPIPLDDMISALKALKISPFDK